VAPVAVAVTLDVVVALVVAVATEVHLMAPAEELVAAEITEANAM
jgi:hypothetical protein